MFTHRLMVKELTKPGEDIIKELSIRKANLLHMAVGISGEAGELLDAIKKHAIYNTEIDVDNIIEELGDLEFFMEGIRQELELDRDTILRQNVEKLAKRYPDGRFTNIAARERKDKENEAQ